MHWSTEELWVRGMKAVGGISLTYGIGHLFLGDIILPVAMIVIGLIVFSFNPKILGS